MKVGDITAVLEAFAPLRIQESWDNSGLIIGSPEDEVHGVLVGFDCTRALIDEAVEKGCDMVVTHHPLIFKGVKRIDGNDPVGAAIMQAIRKGVAVYAAHTTADKVITGVSGAMARRLELTNVSIMVPEEDGTIGLGCIGDFPHPMTGKEALQYVQEKFGLKVIKSSRPLETPITRVAILGGSGGGEIAQAMSKGAQLYITADIPTTTSLPRKALCSWTWDILRVKWRLWTFSLRKSGKNSLPLQATKAARWTGAIRSTIL